MKGFGFVVSLVVVIVILCPQFALGQELLGATEAVRRMIERDRKPKLPAVADKNPVVEFLRDLQSFQSRAESLAPGQAAREWLSLTDRFMKLQPESVNSGNLRLEFKDVIAALPPPTTWSTIADLIKARSGGRPAKTVRDACLSLITAMLVGDRKAQWNNLQVLESIASRASANSRGVAQPVVELGESLARTNSDTDRLMRAIEIKLAAQQLGSYSQITIPDLVSLIGPQRAEAILRRILLNAQTEVQQIEGEATQRIAHRVALSIVNKLKVPQWTLTHDLHATELYEAMYKRFGSKSPTGRSASPLAVAAAVDQGINQSRESARTYYVLGLIVAGRTREAATKIGSVNLSTIGYSGQGYRTEAIDVIGDAGFIGTLFDLLQSALAKKPDLPLWEEYLKTATRASKLTPALKFIQSVLARQGLTTAVRDQLEDLSVHMLLAVDRVEEAVALLKNQVSIRSSQPTFSYTRSDPVSSALQIAELGRLTERPEWVREGVEAARKSLSVSRPNQYSYATSSYSGSFEKLGLFQDAERALIESLLPVSPDFQDRFVSTQRPEALIELAGLYHRIGRHEDVLILLDRAPGWGAKDLSDALSVQDREGTPLGFMSAAAFAATGNRDKALAILEPTVRARPGFDPAYELLLKLRGHDAMPLLDQLYRWNRFEERPLIWKSQLLLSEGKLAEAEQTARQAIAVDPSDGEQGKGHRMRVYSVLADILEARGDHQHAGRFRGAVKAVRTAERADDFVAAGLHMRAVKQYEESLKYFADAYCIESRLALQYASQGNLQRAELHYRRAYELMPESFGRMESHCFG